MDIMEPAAMKNDLDEIMLFPHPVSATTGKARALASLAVASLYARDYSGPSFSGSGGQDVKQSESLL
jgi:hypothetical protein